MFKISYQYINPAQNRFKDLLKSYERGEEISEPVQEIFENDNEKILALICLEKKNIISHISWGRRGNKAGTALTKLNLERIEKIPNIDTLKILEKPEWESYKGFFGTDHTYVNSILAVPFIQLMRETFPSVDEYITKSETDYEIIDRLTDYDKQIINTEQDAVEMALRIGNIISRKTYTWSPTEQGKTSATSFFSGIKKENLDEDDVIRYDLNKIPGFSVIKDHPFGHYILGNENTYLHVFHANKNKLEHTLGVDLIYFNEDHKSFIFVQYKMAEKQGDDYIFRIPNKQLSKEINRMDNVLKTIRSTDSDLAQAVSADNFRLTDNPFFIKVCPRNDFDPDRHEQIKGMIVPLQLWKEMEGDNNQKYFGPNGGKYVSFDNCPRYFDNTSFINLFRKGWVGTDPHSHSFLEAVIREIIEKNKSVIFATKLSSTDTKSEQDGDQITKKTKKTRKRKIS